LAVAARAAEQCVHSKSKFCTGNVENKLETRGFSPQKAQKGTKRLNRAIGEVLERKRSQKAFHPSWVKHICGLLRSKSNFSASIQPVFVPFCAFCGKISPKTKTGPTITGRTLYNPKKPNENNLKLTFAKRQNGNLLA
jgi:hypothetical protein